MKDFKLFLNVIPKDLQYILKYYYPYIMRVWKQGNDGFYIRKAHNGDNTKDKSNFRLKFWRYAKQTYLLKEIGGYLEKQGCPYLTCTSSMTVYNIVLFILSH